MNYSLKIITDLDGVLVNFNKGYNEYFNTDIYSLSDAAITLSVETLKTNYKYWRNLEVLNNIDFEPWAYCTARINSKSTTKTWLKRNNFPKRPVYQVKGYNLSKVSQLKRIPHKGDFYVFIDDSWKNVQDALAAGIPALLYTSVFNKDIDTPYRINTLNYKTIFNAYKRLYF